MYTRGYAYVHALQMHRELNTTSKVITRPTEYYYGIPLVQSRLPLWYIGNRYTTLLILSCSSSRIIETHQLCHGVLLSGARYSIPMFREWNSSSFTSGRTSLSFFFTNFVSSQLSSHGETGEGSFTFFFSNKKEATKRQNQKKIK